jgi:hypothetical protein
MHGSSRVADERTTQKSKNKMGTILFIALIIVLMAVIAPRR